MHQVPSMQLSNSELLGGSKISIRGIYQRGELAFPSTRGILLELTVCFMLKSPYLSHE
jgi:hypothetical protein